MEKERSQLPRDGARQQSLSLESIAGSNMADYNRRMSEGGVLVDYSPFKNGHLGTRGRFSWGARSATAPPPGALPLMM